MIQKILGQDGIIEKALSSRAFLWVCGLLTFIFWYTGLNLSGVVILLSISGLVFCFCKNTIPGMLIFSIIFFAISTRDMSFEGNTIWLFAILIPIAGIIINLVRFKAHFELRGFTFATILCILPWLLMGINVSQRETFRVIACIGVAVVVLLLYLFFVVTLRDDGKKNLETFAHIILVISSVLFLEIITYYLRLGSIEAISEAIGSIDSTALLHLGWGGKNNVSSLLSLTMPVTFYFATKKHKLSFLFIIYGMAQYVAILLTGSRGAMLFATLLLPVIIIYSIVKAKNKISILMAYVIVILSGIIIYLKIDDIFAKLFSRFAQYGLDGVGRDNLFAEGLAQFAKYPLFGVGFDYKSELFFQYVPTSNGPAYYHSTFIQILASFGIFGGIIYFYFYYWRYRVLFTDFSSLKFAMLVGMLMFELYNLIDTNYFQPQGYLLLLFISLVMEKSLARCQTLPLAVKGFDLLRCKKQTKLQQSFKAI